MSSILSIISLNILSASAVASVSGVTAPPASTASLPVGVLTCSVGTKTTRAHATVVGTKHTLLTAGHLFENPMGKRVHCTFNIPTAEGRKPFKARAYLVRTGGTQNLRKLSRAVDWAVMHLDKPLPHEFEPVPYSEFPIGSDLLDMTMAHFNSVKRPRVILNTPNCNPARIKARSNVFAHSCPAVAGMSGAPMMVLQDGKWTIVGLHSGSSNEKGTALLLKGAAARALGGSLPNQSPYPGLIASLPVDAANSPPPKKEISPPTTP